MITSPSLSHYHIQSMADTKAHLLYVEDDESLSFVTRDNLELNG